MKKSRILLSVLMMLVVAVTFNSIHAVDKSIIDTTKKGSVTIKALSQLNKDTTSNTALKGVEYTLYMVDEVAGTTVTTVDEAEAKISSLTATASKKTGTDGVASFTSLDQGRYYAKVTGYPDGTSEVPESFLVDVPMTNATGDGWVYDITVNPKVQVATGEVTLTKVKEDGTTPIQGVEFTAQVSVDNGTTWNDYVPAEQTQAVKLTTDSEGKVELTNLPITYNEKTALYRLIETKAKDENYVLDNKYASTIKVNSDGTVTVTDTRANTSNTAAKGEITVVNEIPTVTKKVKGNLDVASANFTDTVPFTITASLPSIIGDMTTFTLTDTLPAGLSTLSNIKVNGTISSGTEEIASTAYTMTNENGVLTITFKPTEITKYSAVIVTYDAAFDTTKAVIGSEGNENTVVLTYTNNVDTQGKEVSTKTAEDSAKVVTGGIKIKKVDPDKNVLAGAKFKIATTEENAKNSVFVKGTDGQDIMVTSGSDGYATINGLQYEDDEKERSYYLVEIESPTYTDVNGDTQHYTLLKAPLKVAVSGVSHTIDIEVINREQTVLPLTGGVGTIVFIVLGIVLFVIARNVKASKEE